MNSGTENPTLARKQTLLNLVLVGLAIPGVLFGMAMFILWLLGRVPPIGALVGLGVQPFYAFSYWLGRRGQIRLAAYIPVVAVFLAMVIASLQTGLGHVTYIGYAMATLAASMLIGSGAGVFFALLSTAAHLGVGYLQMSGRLASTISPVDSYLADGIGLGLGLIVMIAFTGIYHREIQEALGRERSLRARLEERGANMEAEIRTRTEALERRLVQIRTAAEISRSIAAVLNPQRLLGQVVDLVRERFGLYYAAVFLLDEDSRYAVLQAGTGEAGRKMLAEGHKLAVGGTSMVGWATANRQARISQDVGQESIRFNNPHLPDTRSEMAIPILRGDTVLGALSIQSTQPDAFDADDITILRSIADSLATALQNAQLFETVQANLDEIGTLHRQYLARAWDQVIAREAELSYTAERDAGQDGDLADDKAKFILTVPIQLRDEKIGQLVIEKDEPPGPDERAVIEAVALQTALSLENARLLEDAQRLAQRERQINRISGLVRSSVDLEAILQDTIRELGIAVGASRAFIQVGLEAGEQGSDYGSA